MLYTPYRDEELNLKPGDTVTVYRWLKSPVDPTTGRRERVYSVAHATRTGGRGRVIGHVRDITLTHARAMISASRVAAVRERGVREVCAWVTGVVTDPTTVELAGHRVDFDPFSDDPKFRFVGTDRIFDGADAVRFGKDGMMV